MAFDNSMYTASPPTGAQPDPTNGAYDRWMGYMREARDNPATPDGLGLASRMFLAFDRLRNGGQGGTTAAAAPAQAMAYNVSGNMPALGGEQPGSNQQMLAHALMNASGGAGGGLGGGAGGTMPQSSPAGAALSGFASGWRVPHDFAQRAAMMRQLFQQRRQGWLDRHGGQGQGGPMNIQNPPRRPWPPQQF